MFETPSQPEESVGEVPRYIFDKTWRESNFLIPEDEKIRSELKKQYESFARHKVMDLEENQEVSKVLLARIAAIQAYDTAKPKTKEQVPIRAESRRERIIALARELNEGNETFPFPGLDPEAYAKLKADIAGDEGRSLYEISSPTIDELIERLKKEGMKVVRTKTSDGTYGRDAVILPSQSSDTQSPNPLGSSSMSIQSESVRPKHLQITEGMDERLKELILLSKSTK